MALISSVYYRSCITCLGISCHLSSYVQSNLDLPTECRPQTRAVGVLVLEEEVVVKVVVAEKDYLEAF